MARRGARTSVDGRHPQRRLVLVPHDISDPHLPTSTGNGREAPFARDLDPDDAARATWSAVIVDSTGRFSTCTASELSLWWVAVTAQACTTSLNRPRRVCPSSPGLILVSSGKPTPSKGWGVDGRRRRRPHDGVAGRCQGCRQFGQAGKAWLNPAWGVRENRGAGLESLVATFVASESI